MSKTAPFQDRLFSNPIGLFPSTRYQGSKTKIADWIWNCISGLKFNNCLDAFGGTGAVAYRMKQAGKQVTYNDLLKFNYYIGVALIENRCVHLSPKDIDWVLARHPDIEYPSFIQDTFKSIYFTDEENKWLDQTIANLRHLQDPYIFALAFFALCQACIIKRPYNLFHRKNLYIRLADVNRSFGNKATWDKPFEKLFRAFADEANNAVFDNGKPNLSFNLNAAEVPGKFDLVYIDTPYISKHRIGTDYRDFYHFLEGMTIYDNWPQYLDRKSKHRRLKPLANAWTDPEQIIKAFDNLFERFQKSILVVSYRSDGIPGEHQLVSLLKKYKDKVTSSHFGKYKYVLSRNNESKEILLIGI